MPDEDDQDGRRFDDLVDAVERENPSSDAREQSEDTDSGDASDAREQSEDTDSGDASDAREQSEDTDPAERSDSTGGDSQPESGAGSGSDRDSGRFARLADTVGDRTGQNKRERSTDESGREQSTDESTKEDDESDPREESDTLDDHEERLWDQDADASGQSADETLLDTDEIDQFVTDTPSSDEVSPGESSSDSSEPESKATDGTDAREPDSDRRFDVELDSLIPSDDEGGDDPGPRGQSGQRGAPEGFEDAASTGGSVAPSGGSDWDDISQDITDVADLSGMTQVLVLGSVSDPVTDDVCSRLLSHGSDPHNVVVITIADSPTERLRALHEGSYHGGETVVVDVGGIGEPSVQSGLGGDSGNVTIRQVSSPSDVSRLGMVVDNVLSEWGGSSRPTVLCFHSLSELLQYVDLQTAFRFIHVLKGRLTSIGATAHFHMDPEEHSIEALKTLQPVFDEILRVSEDGSVESVRI